MSAVSSTHGDDLDNLAERYAALRGITLRERLGYGIHGIVFAAEDNAKPGFFALKFHREQLPFERECRTYYRLQENNVTRIGQFNVPQLLRVDERWKAIEMTIVPRAFVLDFAGAFVDERPDFSEDVIRQWEEDKQEMFGDRWSEVRELLAGLRIHGIHLLDINPGNIAFRENVG